jgi:hypothetical protein
MTAGVPGTGVGGLFYMLTALWMPFRETGRALRGQSSRARWRLVTLQGAIALGVIASVWTTGWLLALIISPARLERDGGNLLRIAPVILQATMLGVVFVGVHTLRLLTVCQRPFGRASGFFRAPSKASVASVSAKSLIRDPLKACELGDDRRAHGSVR